MNATRVAALAVLCVGCTVAWSAYAYPERPLRFLIPFPPGGGADNLARIVGQAAGDRLGQQIVALAKAKPGQLNYASSGNGGPSHLAMEMFKSMADVNIRHVPYKGAVPAATDLIAGQVQMGFFTVSAALPLVAGGRVKVIAIASAQRLPLVPDIPTVGESGLPGHEATTWFGVMVPKGAPAPIVGKLHAVFTQVLKLPDVRERLVNQGFDVIGSTPGEFGAYIRSELKRWSKVVKASHASID